MSNFYKTKKVLVIGGAGYVGSNLCEKLAADEAGNFLDNYSSGTESIIVKELNISRRCKRY